MKTDEKMEAGTWDEAISGRPIWIQPKNSGFDADSARAFLNRTFPEEYKSEAGKIDLMYAMSWQHAQTAANPPEVSAEFPEAEMRSWVQFKMGENYGLPRRAEYARWGFEQGKRVSAPQPAPDERKVEPSPLTDEELEQLREIEAKDAADERKGADGGEDMPESGFGERHEAWRYRQIHPLVDQMGGWANARYWIQRHATEYFRTCENLEAEIARLKAPAEPTREQVAELVEAAREVVKRWDALGVYKDDDFGEVAEAMEVFRKSLAPFAEKGGS